VDWNLLVSCHPHTSCNAPPHTHQGADAANPRACATAFPCAVRQGLLFVRPKPLSEAAADESTIPIVDEFEDPEWVTQVCELLGVPLFSVVGCRVCSCMLAAGRKAAECINRYQFASKPTDRIRSGMCPTTGPL
jgi:hypothetical protein